MIPVTYVFKFFSKSNINLWPSKLGQNYPHHKKLAFLTFWRENGVGFLSLTYFFTQLFLLVSAEKTQQLTKKNTIGPCCSPVGFLLPYFRWGVREIPKKKKTPEIPRKRQRVSWSLLDLCHLGILLSRCRPINGRHGSCRTLWCGIPFISGPWCLESGKVANSTTSSRNSSKKLGISRWPAWLRGNLSLQHVIHSSTLGWQNRYDGDNFSLSLSDHLECDWILFGGLFKWP